MAPSTRMGRPPCDGQTGQYGWKGHPIATRRIRYAYPAARNHHVSRMLRVNGAAGAGEQGWRGAGWLGVGAGRQASGRQLSAARTGPPDSGPRAVALRTLLPVRSDIDQVRLARQIGRSGIKRASAHYTPCTHVTLERSHEAANPTHKTGTRQGWPAARLELPSSSCGTAVTLSRRKPQGLLLSAERASLRRLQPCELLVSADAVTLGPGEAARAGRAWPSIP